MPPRLPGPIELSSVVLCIRPRCLAIPPPIALSPRIQAANASSRPKKVKKDPWAMEQIAKKRAIHEARKKELQEERASTLGDPVRGTTTSFLESFDDVGGAAKKKASMTIDPDTFNVKTNFRYPSLNYYLTPDSLVGAIKSASTLASPPTEHSPAEDPEDIRATQEAYERGHVNAVKALPIITSLANASSAEKSRQNVQRCIDTFGRHHTDKFLAPRLRGDPMHQQWHPEAHIRDLRVGRDTGSSEVQIALLTAKIRRLADEQDNDKVRSNDKHGKRHLRLLVHRRQKLLKYLRRQDRGGPRWQRVTEMLGLGDATWKGEITL